MSTLRSKVIRLAHTHPEFRSELLETLKEAAPSKEQVRFEVHIRAALRDYKTDPESPIQTFDTGMKSIAYTQLYFPDAKSAKPELKKLVEKFKRDWESDEAFVVDTPQTHLPGGVRQKDNRVNPKSYYARCEISITQATRSGYGKTVLDMSWDRTTDRWS